MFFLPFIKLNCSKWIIKASVSVYQDHCKTWGPTFNKKIWQYLIHLNPY